MNAKSRKDCETLYSIPILIALAIYIIVAILCIKALCDRVQKEQRILILICNYH